MKIARYDYLPAHDIFYTPDEDGVYQIVAKLSIGEITDLTSKAMVKAIS